MLFVQAAPQSDATRPGRRIDASAALAMPGVKAILTADDLPKPTGGEDLGKTVAADPPTSGADERAALRGRADSRGGRRRRTDGRRSDRADSDRLEPLPFVIDPLESLRPGGPNARTEGNVWMRKPGANADQPVPARWSSAR